MMGGTTCLHFYCLDSCALRGCIGVAVWHFFVSATIKLQTQAQKMVHHHHHHKKDQHHDGDEIVHEVQSRMFCGKHMLNNLVRFFLINTQKLNK